MYRVLLPLLLSTAASTSAQPARLTVANTHSHNDYEQPIPFWMAWQEKFGSIEADIWLVDGVVIVAHDRQELQAGRRMEDYYIRPLAACMAKNAGHPYADTSRRLQILIDVKEDSVAALAGLIALLDKYPVLEHSPSLKWVISGNRPSPDSFAAYPAFIAFDGILHAGYSREALSRVVMMSDDLREYTSWDGHGEMTPAVRRRITAAILSAHEHHLPVRFWNAPDFPDAWRLLCDLGVDCINTDHIRELASWLDSH